MPEQLRKNKALLTRLLKQQGGVSNYTYPVFMIDGKLTHSHEQLQEFLNELK